MGGAYDQRIISLCPRMKWGKRAKTCAIPDGFRCGGDNSIAIPGVYARSSHLIHPPMIDSLTTYRAKGRKAIMEALARMGALGEVRPDRDIATTATRELMLPEDTLKL